MSPDPAVCLFGAGGHGRVVASQLTQAGVRSIVFCDHALQGQSVCGYPVPFASVQDILAAGSDLRVVVTLGDNERRRQLHERLAERIASAVIIEPGRVYTDHIAEGTQILAGAVVNVEARIGAGTIINTNAVVEHDCSVGSFSHVAPGAVIGGGAVVGDGVLIGAGAVVLPGVRVASGAIVGGGALVARDISHGGTWTGVPARPQQRVNR
ncbi:NeuD/PglB/VioB family sugar acetyltransferase [Pelagerythrobacter marinus]|jgi:UDP-perosamine 4-acetyltransferase|uniref:NeuD/PglB/VioB family sugar acetyltransferase n=1 Tax=Pelagerythrobacter marinus TaxID=538382 RepID=UPI001EED1104|nr:NeuD/PglB/VioB family sugar acetyltransferase [Pelagerythrobacter marinus]